MKMDMIGDAGAGRLAKIHSDIETLWGQVISKYFPAKNQEAVDFKTFLMRKISDFREVPVRGDHQMAIGIGILVHNDKGMLASSENPSAPVLFR